MSGGGPPLHVRALSAVIRHVPRGRYALLSKLAPAEGRFETRLAPDIGGARFACDLSDQLSREACFTGLYEPPFTRVFQKQLRPGAVVVDAGANWGYFTLIAAAAAGPSGRVIALEPDPRLSPILERNIDLNGFTQVEVRPIAAGAVGGRLVLTGYGDTEANRGTSSIATRDGAGTAREFEVECTTIDALTAQHPEVDVVKIDVEGAEDLVLEGMREGLAAKRYRAILLELHPTLLAARGIAPEACVDLLSSYGYRGWTIDATTSAYRRAADPATRVESLLGPLDDWRACPWPHLLWLC